MAEEKKQTDAVEDEKATKLEIMVTVLLGIATILGAVAAYFAALWGGEMQSSYSKSITETNHANTVYLEALSDLSNFNMDDLRDDIIYSEWKENLEKGDTQDAAYFFSKLSEGFQKDLADNPGDVSEYEKQQLATADSIQAQFVLADKMHDDAEELMKKGSDANKYGDDFTLCTVLFTIVLFFLGLASLKTKPSIRKIYIVMACVVLLGSIIKMVTLPFPSL
jgi:flagellar basal body-associated protein FliL